MKKFISIFTLLFICLFANAEELTGFFGFNLGESLEEFKQDEIFELCEVIELPRLIPWEEENYLDVLFKQYNIDCVVYKLSLRLEVDWLGKHAKNIRVKENNKTKLISLRPEINKEKNDKRIKLWDRFQYAGTEVSTVTFVFINERLAYIQLSDFGIGSRWFERHEKYNGYVQDVHGNVGFSYLADNSRSGFQLLRDTVAEKYNLEYQETISRLLGLGEYNVVFKYSSQNKLKLLYFSCDCDYTFAFTQRDGRIDHESIVLVDNKMVLECLEGGIKLFNRQKAIKEQEILEEQKKLKKALMDEI